MNAQKDAVKRVFQKQGLKFRNFEIIAWTTIIFAIFLYFADKFSVRKKGKGRGLASQLILGIMKIG